MNEWMNGQTNTYIQTSKDKENKKVPAGSTLKISWKYFNHSDAPMSNTDIFDPLRVNPVALSALGWMAA